MKPREHYKNDDEFSEDNSIEFDIFMDNYLGPDQQTVIQEYQEFLNKVKND